MRKKLGTWPMGWAILSSALLLITSMACSSSQSSPLLSRPTVISSAQDEAFELLRVADVVYLGERHDSAEDHAAQLAIIQALHRENPDLAIALEMFQRPFQPVIDQYLAGEISEAALVEQTEYLLRWRFPWQYYAPLLRFAQTHQLPVLALNAPTEITQQIAQEGLSSLAGEDWRYIPPLSDIDTSNTDYQAFVMAAFGSHGSHGSFDFENFFAAQVTWDETMAMTIADFLQVNPDTQVVVLAGSGHVVYGYGIPDRVARRLGDSISQQIVLLNPSQELIQEAQEGDVIAPPVADVFWLHSQD